MELLLASRSPRRRQLLAQLGWSVSFVDMEVEERLERPVAAPQRAEALACLKSDSYDKPLLPTQVLVTADTVVVHQGEALGKPRHAEEARAMLRSLSGDVHQVYTGVCLKSDRKRVSFTECTHVHFRPLEEREITYYIDHYHHFDKAGAYGIQEWIGMVAVSRIEGCYYNVMGLPMARLCAELRAFA